MDKNAIKKFAVWARRELISRVSQRAAWYGITEKDPIDEKATVLHGKVLTENEQTQRRALIARIRAVGFQQVMEEVAYTWFNRFIALRFMEVNGYLPSYTRVFSDDNGAFNPQILKDALHLDLNGLDMEKVYAMEEADDAEALFKYLVITQCNDLNRMLPAMFERIADYTELLFPDFLLREGSVAHQMVTSIPEEDWKDAVQIIGWLYQYYNTEPNEKVYDGNMAKSRIPKELLPAATTIYTPDWSVRYMVENSLGRLWIDNHPMDEVKNNWKYYLDAKQQGHGAEEQQSVSSTDYKKIDPANILCTDPCMGSGHILVYLFDVLMQIYLSYGYTTNEAVESIVRNNLWGMDIDDRAAQMAYFAVMMKAQQYDKRWLIKQINKPVQPNVFALQDSTGWETFEPRMRQMFVNHPSIFEDKVIQVAKELFLIFEDAKEFGSIIQSEIQLEDLDLLEKVLDDIDEQTDLMDIATQADAILLTETLKPLIRQCKGLVQKYHVIVTNPPYLGSSRFSNKLDTYVKAHYPDAKSDLSMVMYSQAIDQLSKEGAYIAFITTSSWMFLSSFEKLRQRVFSMTNISSLVDYGTELFEGKVGHNSIVSWVTHRTKESCAMIGVRLVDFCYSRRDEKESQFFNDENRYIANTKSFTKIPGTPVAYWVSENITKIFEKKKLYDYGRTCQGLATGDNDRFLKYWFEPEYSNIFWNCESHIEARQSSKKWYPCTKGGSFRRWYGNWDYVINWQNDGVEIKNFSGSVIRNPDYYFKRACTWSTISIGKLSMRFSPTGSIFESKGAKLFVNDDENLDYILALMNTKVIQHVLSFLAPTMDYHEGPVSRVPVIITEEKELIDSINKLTEENIHLCKTDWDSFENSWDFKWHPFVWYSRELWDTTNIAANLQTNDYKPLQPSCPLETCWLLWQRECETRFNNLKANEEELNCIFIGIYGLQNELTPNVDDKDVTVRKADLSRDIRSFISYAVGCMFGRYSLDKEGLVLAGQKFDSRYAHNPEGYQYGDLTTLQGNYLIDDDGTQIKCSYVPDRDGILPITDDEYFDDDIVGLFINFVRTVYSSETLEANLQFIAKALGGSGAPRDVIRQYFLNDFYKDHLKIYQKRPIYWLFDSGKKNGFKCLIYMHRYQPDTIARIRTDYLHETQARYRNAIETLERQSTNASTSERVKMTKRLTALKAQAEEARAYEEKIHHLADQMIKIDLDDGVKVNYAKFADVLAPIK